MFTARCLLGRPVKRSIVLQWSHRPSDVRISPMLSRWNVDCIPFPSTMTSNIEPTSTDLTVRLFVYNVDILENSSLGQCHKCAEMFSSTDDTCEILGQIYHSSCAVCVVCGRSVKNKHYFVKDQLYCEEDFLVRHRFCFFSSSSSPSCSTQVIIKPWNIVLLVII